MRLRTFILLCAATGAMQAVIIDRIAIVAGNAIIKESDISRDLRLTDFLNAEKLDLGESARKTAASRLVDQVFIRREVRIGDYPTASVEDAEKQIHTLEDQRFKSDDALQSGLARYGLTEADLRMHLQWQLTVLRFIDARFKPAAYVTDQEIEQYFKVHQAELHRQYPAKSSLNDLRPEIQNVLAGEKVNQLFFQWLDEQRKSNKVKYLEAGLQ